MKNSNTFRLLGWAIILSFLCSCNAYLHQPMKTRSARIGEETTLTQTLRQLPPPQDKLVVAVYKFRDQTGQYKPSETGASWSTAVTQGATNILLKSLEDSGWFMPIERENVSNLLNERKIIRSSRQQYLTPENKDKAKLPPLLYAGIILEGGIVSYDANTITGGAGLRYFGMGGGGQYRQDRVTVYLRAISTKTGKILKTVYTSKTVLSQSVDVGVFQFVKFKRLLEVETGFTYNEPSELAVTEAIEKAVQSLVLEGIVDKLWSPHEGATKAADAAVAAYQIEKQEMRETDIFNHRPSRFRPNSSLHINAVGLRYEGDYANPMIKSGFEVGLSQKLNKSLSVNFNFGTGELASERFFNQKFSYGDLSLQFRFLPNSRFSPFVFGGAGWMGEVSSTPFNFNGKQHMKIQGGLGFEYMLNDYLGIQTSFDNNYFLNDKVDAMNHGKLNDYFWRAKIGLAVYFGKK